MDHARRLIDRWRIEYNTERPHSSLGNLTPDEYARGLAEAAVRQVSLTAGSTCVPD